MKRKKIKEHKVIWKLLCIIRNAILYYRWKKEKKAQAALATRMPKLGSVKDKKKGRVCPKLAICIILVLTSFGISLCIHLNKKLIVRKFDIDPANFLDQPMEDTVNTFTETEEQIYNHLYYSFYEDTGFTVKTLKQYESGLILELSGLEDYSVSDAPDIENSSYCNRTYDTTTEIDNIIRKYEDKTKVPLDVYSNEIYIRWKQILSDPTGERIYQLGRSANDAFDVCLETDVEAEIFYASVAVYYYMKSYKMNNCSESRNDISLKIGIIFNKLAERNDLEEYKEHFFFMSSIFLELCDDYDSKDNYCSELFEYYYGSTLFSVGEIIGNKDILDRSKLYLEKYIKKEERRAESIRRNQYIESCTFLITLIDAKSE